MRSRLGRIVSVGAIKAITGGTGRLVRKRMLVAGLLMVLALLIASFQSAGQTQVVDPTATGNQSLASRAYRDVSSRLAAFGTWVASHVRSERGVAGPPYQPVTNYLTPPFIDAPSNLSVTNATSSTISLSWSAPAGGADHYLIERSENVSGPFFQVASVTGPTHNDSTVTNLHAYLYRVRAVSGTAVVSMPSNMALGTAISFEFTSLQGKLIKAQHFYDVRAAINLVRAVANRSAFNWARGSLGGLTIKADDVNEMRTALDEALADLSIPLSAYQDTPLNVGANGTLIQAIHLEQLQSGSTRGSSTSTGPFSPDSSAARLDPMNRTGGGDEDPLSRNFNWSLPLVSLPGRAGLNLQLTLAYNSLVWTKSGNLITFNDDTGFPGPGFQLGFPVLQGPFVNPQSNENAYLLIGVGGSRTELRKVGSTNLYQAVDSSYVLFDAANMTLKTPDGTQSSYQPVGAALHCTKIMDRNGNFISVSYDGSGRIDTITDTLARQLKFVYSGNDLTSITQTWTMNNQQQPTYTWATFVYADQTIQTNFTGVTVVNQPSSIRALTRVNLPDGSHFDFDYTSWGQVWKVREYATSTDDYLLNYRAYNLRGSPMLATGSESDCPRFTERHDWAENFNRDSQGNAQEAITQFAVPASATISDISVTGTLTQVTQPDQTYQKIYFGSSATSPGWQNGLPLVTESYDVTGPRKRWVVTTWTQDDPNASYRLNPRVTESNIYDPSNRARKRVEYATFNLPDQTSCRYPTDVYEYGGTNAATVLRRTHTSYEMSNTYTTRRILGLPSAKYLCDGAQGEVACGDTSGTSLFSKTTYTYDGTGSILGDDQPVQHDHDHYGATVLVAGRGNVSSIARHDVVGTGQPTTSTMQYNTAGGVVKTIDPSNHAIQLSYTDQFAANGTDLDSGLPATLAYPTTITDADNNTIKTRYTYQFGATTWKQTPSPNVTTNQAGPQRVWLFDSIGRLERVKNLVNDSYTRYIYGPNFIETFSSVTSVADQAHSLTVFDGHDRVIAKVSNLPGSVGGFRGEWLVYDVMGRVSQKYNPVETSLETISVATPLHPYTWEPTGDDDPENGGSGWIFTQQTYDWKGRPILTTHTDSTTRIASYAGCGCAGDVVTLQDEGTMIGTELKRRTRRIYSDVLGREWKTELLNWDGSVYSTTVNVYNARDQITNVKQYAGSAPSDASSTNAAASCPSGTCQEALSVYDGYGRLQSKHAPEMDAGTSSLFEYNADDTLHKVTDARGATATYTYNNGRHLLNEIAYTAPSGVTNTATVTFTYDAAGNRKTMADGVGSQSYTYDSLSRLTSETRTFADPVSPFLNGSFTLSYEYNLADGLKKITDPFNTTTDYSHDLAGQLTAVTGASGATSYASGITYRAFGGLKHMDYGNSTKLDRSYNERLQETQFDVKTSGGTRVAGWEYQYARDGQISYSHDLRDDRLDRAYIYDHAARVTTGLSGNDARGDFSFPPTGPYKQTYGQDAWNNLTDRTMRVVGPFGAPITNSYHDNYVNNRNTGGSSQAWVYDKDGRLTNDRTRTYTFDVAGNQLTNSENSISRSFDGDGTMLKRSQSGAVTYFLRSSVVEQTIVELSQSGQKLRSFVYRDGQMLAQHEGSSILWNHDEPTGVTSQWTNSSGAVNSRVEMDPLMTQVPDTNGFTSGGFSAGNPMGFYGNSSNMGAGCARRGAGIACMFNLPVPLNWIQAMTFGFPSTTVTTSTTYRTQVQFENVNVNVSNGEGVPGFNLGGGADRIRIRQVPVTTATIHNTFTLLPPGLFNWARPMSPPDAVGPTPPQPGSFDYCAGDKLKKQGFTKEAADLIKQVNSVEKISVELLAVTWMNESNFAIRPSQNDNGHPEDITKWDVGPFQINIYWTMAQVAKKEVSFEGLNEKNVFGYDFYRSDGKTPLNYFTGDPLSNGRMAARRLNAVGGTDENKAVKYTKPSSQPARKESWDKYAQAFRDFFKCYTGRLF